MDDDNFFYDVMLWIPKFLFLIVVTFVLMAIIHAAHTQDLSSDRVDLEVMVESMYNSPDIFAYQDPLTKRVYPGKIDINHFTNLNLDDVMESQSKRFIAEIELYNQSKLVGTKYFLSNRKSSEKNFNIRLTTKDFSERISEELIVSKPVEVINENKILFEGNLIFKTYIEK